MNQLKKRLQRGRKIFALSQALGTDVLGFAPEISVSRMDLVNSQSWRNCTTDRSRRARQMSPVPHRPARSEAQRALHIPHLLTPPLLVKHHSHLESVSSVKENAHNRALHGNLVVFIRINTTSLVWSSIPKLPLDRPQAQWIGPSFSTSIQDHRS